MRYNWYYKELGRMRGPVSTPELVAMLSRGDIGPETSVLHHSIGRWVPACRVRGLCRREAPRREMPRPDSGADIPTLHSRAVRIRELLFAR